MKAEGTCQLLEKNVAIPFEQRLSQHGCWPIAALQPTVLQMNLGYRCNQRCAHCHLQAGPERREEMPVSVVEAALNFADHAGISDFDLTGGAPELHPHFRRLVDAIRARGGHATDRCNLTVFSEPGQERLIEFLAEHRVRIVASLPHYSPEATERMRGRQVFDKSITALQSLNAVGYGQPDGNLELTLAYNPAGAFLPGQQESLESDFRNHLRDRHGINFTTLIALTNMPTGRFLSFLIKSGNLRKYMRRLEESFNPATLPSLMCRTTISVGWDGTLYDCDFNQGLGIEIRNGRAMQVHTVPLKRLVGREVRCRTHCYGCTAGQGSSCGGAVA